MQFHTSISSKKEAWLKKILDEASLRRRSDVFAFAEWALVDRRDKNYGGSLAVMLRRGKSKQMKIFFRTNLFEPALEFEADVDVELEKEAKGDLRKSMAVNSMKLMVAVAKARILAFIETEVRKKDGKRTKSLLKKAILGWLAEDEVDLNEVLFMDRYGAEKTKKKVIDGFVEEQVKLCVDYEIRRFLNHRK